LHEVAAMMHYTLDAFKSFRSRLDEVKLVYEIMEEAPEYVGLRPAMQPFILPYYHGVEPDDCGISAFVLLPGGHFTLHTFSYHEVYFADLFSEQPFDTRELHRHLEAILPAREIKASLVRRDEPFAAPPADPEKDFGPHLFLDVHDYRGPSSLDDLFDLFDGLPERIGMTPIMRPYGLKSVTPRGEPVSSIMTMIAESHISLHVYPERSRAYLDLFSCRFFDADAVLPELLAAFPGEVVNRTLIARGRDYARLRTERAAQGEMIRRWLGARPDRTQR